MKTMSKKIASIVLALCLCFSLVGTALAASSPDETGSITVNGVAGESYSIYKIFDLSYTDDGTIEDNSRSSYSYKVVDEWSSFLKDYTITTTNALGETEEIYLFIITDEGYLDPSSPILTYTGDDHAEVIAQFAKDALAYASETDDIIATDTQVANNEGTAYFGDLELGWYLVDSSLGTLCMLTSTDPNVEITEKNPTPTIEKFVRDTNYDEDFDTDGDGEPDEKVDDADNTNTLEYELDISTVGNVSSLIIHDYMDPNQFDMDTFDIESVILYASADATTGTTLVLDTDYTVVMTPETCGGEGCGMDGCTFEIHIVDSVLDGLDNTAYIVVLYDVALDEQFEDFTNDLDEIDNWANVTFGATSMATPVEAETYSYGFEIYKYTADTSYTFTATIPTAAPGEATANDHYYLYYVVEENGEDVTYYVELYDDGNGSYSYKGVTTTAPTSVDADEGTFGFITVTSEDGEAGDSESFTILGLDTSYTYSVADLGGIGDNGTLTASSDSGTPLAGAVFTVQNSSGEYGYFVYDDETEEYLLEGWVTIEGTVSDDQIPENAPEGSSFFVTSQSDGMAYIEGLHEGTFTVTETEAPDGYNKLESPITVTIAVVYDEETGTYDYSSFTVNGSYDHTVSVLNNAGTELPSTGGIGTTIFYIIGGILVVGAVVVLVTRRRMTRSEG